jgi:hypothetical protein
MFTSNRWIVAIGLACASVLAAPRVLADEAKPAKTRQLSIANKTWTGDFDKLLERRMIRVYAPFSRSLYFNDRGARARSGQVVQQCRDRRGAEDRHRDDDVRAQHLQVLCDVQAHARCGGGAAERDRVGEAAGARLAPPALRAAP